MLTIQFATNIDEDIETVNWVTQGLEVMEHVTQGDTVSDGDIQDFIRVAGQIEQRLRSGSPYKKVTVHRYRPREDLGSIMGFLNCSRQRMVELVDLGFNLACPYDPVMESIIPK
jgi:hypothetical protein